MKNTQQSAIDYARTNMRAIEHELTQLENDGYFSSEYIAEKMERMLNTFKSMQFDDGKFNL